MKHKDVVNVCGCTTTCPYCSVRCMFLSKVSKIIVEFNYVRLSNYYDKHASYSGPENVELCVYFILIFVKT